MDPDKVSPESLILQIKTFLKTCLISSPVHANLKRQLAECLIGTGKPLEGVLHLVESLGGKHKFDHLKLEQEYELKGGASNKENIRNIEIVKVFNSIPLEYPSPTEFLADLNSLPVEWMVVQISRQPQTGNILQDVQEHRENQWPFSLGEARLVVMRSGETPLQVLLDKPQGSDDKYMKSYFDLVSEALKIDISSKLRTTREESSRLIKDVSKSLGECWLRKYQCLLPGQLKSVRLTSALHNTLSTIRSSLVTMETEAEAFLRLLLNGVHVLSETQVYDMLRKHVTKEDELLTEHLSQHVMKFKQQYGTELSTAARYPVILLLEEELDKLPWETTVCLRSSPVTRVHCFQFLMAMVKLHGSQSGDQVTKPRLRNGYLHLPRIHHENETFVILNPSSDIPALETNFKTFLSKKLGKWQGIVGRVPTASEFEAGLRDNSLFIYCGHGDGTVFFSSDKLGRSRIRAVTMLFGCRSVERSYHGGRVPFSSIVQKYFIAGCPCITGNLWSVTSTDCDRLASNLINLTFPSPSPLDLSSITSIWWNVPPPPHLAETPDRHASEDEKVSATDGAGNCLLKDPSAVDVTRFKNAAVKAASSGEWEAGSLKISTPNNGTDCTDSKTTAKNCTRSTVGGSTVISGTSNVPTVANGANTSSLLVSYSPDFCANIQWVRQGAANYFLNGAALVVWGLPVWFGNEDENC